VSDYSSHEIAAVPGALRGYRIWYPTVNGRQLRSIAIGASFWNPGVNEATCYFPYNCFPHAIPRKSCKCGFYAKHTLEALERDFGYQRLHVLAYGSIKAYGRVVLGTAGFRAQYAEIEALFVDPFVGTRLRWHGGWKGIPMYQEREMFLKDYPPISVENLLPEPQPDPILQYKSLTTSLDLTQEQAARLWAMMSESPDIDKES
jgi:hypothetical protein